MTKKKAKKKPTATPEPDSPQDASGSFQPDLRLPPRLFATDRFPTKRLNIYSSPEILPFLRHVLRDTKEFQIIRESCFGKLFDIPARQCPVSAKLIHSFLTRQLVCLPKNTLWSVLVGTLSAMVFKSLGRIPPRHHKASCCGERRSLEETVWEEDDAQTRLFQTSRLPFDTSIGGISRHPPAVIFHSCGTRPAHTHGLRRWLSTTTQIHRFYRCRVEFSSDLAVSPIIPIESQPQSGWGEWPNDPKDDCVIYMEQLIADQFTFNKGMWPAGVTTEPLLIKPKARGHRKGMFPTRVKQSLKPKKVIKKETSSRKQRRISSYFTRSSVASFTNEQLSEMVLKLQKQMKQLHKLLQKKKKTSHPMQRSFHTLISRSKKPATSHKARHEAPIHQDAPDTSHHQHQPVQAPPLDDDHPTDQSVLLRLWDVDAMETDEQPSSQSPIISQYAVHLQRQASASLNIPLQTTPNDSPPRTPTPFSSPDSVETIHTPTVHGLSDHNHTTVHTSPDHNSDSEMIPPDENTTNTIPEDDIQTTPNQPIVPPHPHRHLSNRPEPKSVIYDKSDHPNSPEINHILCHGLRIYDPISPDPPLSNPPIFDSTIGPSSAPDIPLRLSPLPFTPLTSPAKSNDNGLGFLSHTATPNAFAATASTSPPVIGRPTIVPAPADESQGDDEAVIDLTQTKDPPRHVPSMEENHLAKELFSSPLVPAIALISPLPQMEWDLFEKILKANINVYHTTRFEFEFSNKSLLQLAEPKQWTTTYQMELLVHMLSARHSDILQREHAAFAPPTLAKIIQDNHAIQFDKALIQLNSLIADKATSSGTNDNSTIATKDTLQPPNQPSDANNSRAQLINIAVAAIVVGTMTWIYAKITN
ncbi:hypothetical protein IGI04_039629 [Brassica rapa subsp. trilocularis]|uniref:DUF1985 domain-containing protein n=1 Tax=Brassica rapa subsp. trilocularis TaxID=1813537 RepID=A0ABQ7KLE8_BRACM|nr:hypothetical protein IGI04_039629 [Brassica rapa subsp. trilocularis]